ncbi:MAG: D-aminoacylase [Actinomycetota bacterium]|nr:D-aminoacylase [Actinomycetota bacterium]
MKKEGFFMYHLLIKNGTIYDGSGNKPYHSDIAIQDNKIVKIEQSIQEEAGLIIDAWNKIVVPGFIDVHCHDELEILNTDTVSPKVKQGVTTVVNGNCGLGFIPVVREKKKDLYDFNSALFNLDNIEFTWNNYEEFKEVFEKNGNLGINIVNLVPHGALRIAVMGLKGQKASDGELKKMGEILNEYLKRGAYGMSTGLLYPPCSYADVEELKYLCRIIADNNGIFAIHLRNESDKIIESIKQTIEIAAKTNVSAEISHLNISGKNNWGQADDILKIIGKARENGIKINCDQYPYKAGSTFISALLPQWALDGGMENLVNKLEKNASGIKEKIKKEIIDGIEGWDNIIKESGWENIVINSVYHDSNKKLVGKNLLEVAEIKGLDIFEALFNLIREEKGRATVLIFSVCEEDLHRIYKSEVVMVGSDGIKLGDSPHPRLYGTYFKILDEFVKDKKLLPLPKAIRKMTSLPAEKFNIKNRGFIRENYYADIVILNLDKIKNIASYEKPDQTGPGIDLVIINGVIACKNNKLFPNRSGRVL